MDLKDGLGEFHFKRNAVTVSVPVRGNGFERKLKLKSQLKLMMGLRPLGVMHVTVENKGAVSGIFSFRPR